MNIIIAVIASMAPIANGMLADDDDDDDVRAIIILVIPCNGVLNLCNFDPHGCATPGMNVLL